MGGEQRCEVCGRPEYGLHDFREAETITDKCCASDEGSVAICYRLGYARERAGRETAEREVRALKDHYGATVDKATLEKIVAERDALFARLQAATGRHQQEVDTLIDRAVAAEAALAEARAESERLRKARLSCPRCFVEMLTTPAAEAEKGKP